MLPAAAVSGLLKPSSLGLPAQESIQHGQHVSFRPLRTASPGPQAAGRSPRCCQRRRASRLARWPIPCTLALVGSPPAHRDLASTLAQPGGRGVSSGTSIAAAQQPPSPALSPPRHCSQSCPPVLPSLQAFSLAILLRCWRLLSPHSAAWLASSIVLAAADAAWRETDPAGHARWLEVPAAAARLLAFSLGPTWVLMRAAFDDQGPAGAVGDDLHVGGAGAAGVAADAALMAAHLARLLFASGAAKMAANALSFPMRLG